MAGGFENPTMRFSKLYELFLAEKELLKGKSSGDLRNHQNMGKSFLLPALGTKKSRKHHPGRLAKHHQHSFSEVTSQRAPPVCKIPEKYPRFNDGSLRLCQTAQYPTG